MTTFLPQSRIVARNCRSLSVKGRSADVTNSTRSDRGTKSAVIASCSRITALVPGVSTTWISRRNSTGAVIDVQVRRPLDARRLGPVLQQVHLRRGRRDAFLQHAAAEQRIDERALAGVELADDDDQEQLVELLHRSAEGVEVVGRRLEAHQHVAQLRQRRPFVGGQLAIAGAKQRRGHGREHGTPAARRQSPSTLGARLPASSRAARRVPRRWGLAPAPSGRRRASVRSEMRPSTFEVAARVVRTRRQCRAHAGGTGGRQLVKVTLRPANSRSTRRRCSVAKADGSASD